MDFLWGNVKPYLILTLFCTAFVENATPIIAFSATMIGAILLTLPCILLFEKLTDWFKKRRGQIYVV